jgi:hypothetical protein
MSNVADESLPGVPQESTALPKTDIARGEQTLSGRLFYAFLLIVIPLVYFYPAIFGKITLAPGDGWTQIFGIRVLIGQMIRQGGLPLWNPYVFSGMPLLASIQPGALYPTTWMFAVLSPQAAMNWMVITTYHVALIGTYFYARRLGANRMGAMVGGIAFAFGGYMIAHLGHTNRVMAAAWLPWVMLAIEELYQHARWRWVAFGALFIALQLLAGEPQMTCYTIMVAGAYGLFSLILRPARERRLRFLLASLAMALCGVLLSAVQLIPERELLAYGERAAINYDYFSSFSFPPQHLFQQIFPYFFGGAGMKPYTIVYWGKWNTTEVAGYVGMLAMIGGLIALAAQFVESKRNRVALFWAVCAVVAIFLAFGSYQPLGIHRFLHQVPVYNLFRASGRHLFEFDFALSTLAALGVTWVAEEPGRKGLRGMIGGIGAMGVLVLATAIAYRYFAESLTTGLPVSKGANSVTNPEFLIPIVFFIVSAAAVCLYRMMQGKSQALRNAVAGLLVLICLADVWSFGYFYEWNIVPEDLPEKLADAPTVQFIKGREQDLNSFRYLSHATWPYSHNYEKLNFPNVSIVRGLQSVNGYDPLFLNRYAALAGQMGLDGIVQQPAAFGSDDQSFNLLNAKYLLLERPRLREGEEGVIERDGVKFPERAVNLVLSRRSRHRVSVEGTATELVILSAMGQSTHIPDNTVVARVKIFTKQGRVFEHQILAGRDTSEWAIDRPDVKAAIKHGKARVIESYPADGFPGHIFIARYPFERSEVERVEFDYQLSDADLTISHAAFYDAETKGSHPVGLIDLPAERWHKIAEYDNVDVYENLKAMPRAWFVRRAAVALSADVLETIRSGKFKDGSPFDPAETVLFEKEDFGNREITLPSCGKSPDASVRVTRYEPQRIEIETGNAEAGFLVLSEVYFRGWEAWIDGKRTPVEKVDYTLRGLAVPAGKHKIEYKFRAHSFWNGLSYSLLGVFFLLVGAGGGRYGGGRYVKRLEDRLDGPLDRAGQIAKGGAARVWQMARHPRFLLGFFALLLFIYAWTLVRHASYSVGGSDSSGYANIARSLLDGTLVRPVEPELYGLPGGTESLFYPLAYDRGPVPGAMVSFYPMGMPLQMAIASLIAGWERGPFLLSPLAAAFCLILTYLLARDLGLSRGYAIVGASILAASVSFIFMALSPMSDLVTTCWSTLAIWAAVRARNQSRYTWLVGIAFAMAFLTRPTSIFLLPAICLLLGARRELYLRMLIAGLPFALMFFAYNMTAYGHPLRTGYASIGLQNELLVSGVGDRFQHYAYWVSMMMSPLLVAGWAGLALLRRFDWRVRGMLLLWFGSFFAFYCFYNVFDAWWYTRFLLPGYPALVLGAMLTANEVLSRLRRAAGPPAFVAASCALLLIVFAFEIHYVQRYNVFITGKVERVNAASARWAHSVMKPQALVVSMQTSGTLDYYTRRPVLRWDLMAPEQWEVIKKRMTEQGRPLYALLQEHEIEDAKKAAPGKWKELGRMNPISLWSIEP